MDAERPPWRSHLARSAAATKRRADLQSASVRDGFEIRPTENSVVHPDLA